MALFWDCFRPREKVSKEIAAGIILVCCQFGQHIFQIFVDPETVCFCILYKLYMMALASAPRMESTLTQFLRPRVKGRMARSAVLLSIGTFPSVRKNRRYSSWFRLYWRALQVLPPEGTIGRDSFTHAK